MLYKTVLFFLVVLLNSQFSAQIYVQGETVFTVSKDTYIYADSIKFSKKQRAQNQAIVKKGKIITAESEYLTDSYASKHAEQKVLESRCDISTATKEHAKTRAVTEKIKHSAPILYPQIPVRKNTFSVFSKSNAIVSAGGGHTSTKLFEIEVTTFYTPQIFYCFAVRQRISAKNSLLQKEPTADSRRVRPPPMA